MAPTCDLDIFNVATLRTEALSVWPRVHGASSYHGPNPTHFKSPNSSTTESSESSKPKRRAQHQKSKNAASKADGQTIAKSRREIARQYGNNNARGSYGLDTIIQRTPSRESDLFQCFPLYLLCNRSSAGRSR